MQRYILFVLFLCLQWVAQGQTDYEYRYWFDKDDANAQTGTFTPGTLHLDVDLSTLDASLHTIHIQVKNSEGEWSSPVTKFFFKTPMAKQTSLLSWFDDDHKNIKKLEYNGGKPFLLDVSEIEDGFHVLYLQAMGQGGLSMPTTKMFIKVPQTEGVSSLTCVCSINGKLYKTEQVSSEGGIVNWNLDVASLSQGIHNMQVQVLTPTGAATKVSNHFFFRTITRQELNNMKLVYSLDGKEFHTATGDAANGVFHFDVDVASLEDGLHRIMYNLASDNGTSTKVSTSFFWKTPIGGNGIMEYRYWLNDNEANAQVKVLDNRVSPFSLVTLLPMESQPIRSSCFQFEVKDGVPMMYAKNDFHIAFYDASYRRVDETKQFVDYNVSQRVEDIAGLQSTQTFARPQANTVKWYKFEGEKGDTVAFRSSQAMSLQLYAPSGKELYSTSADKSVNYGGCHIWEDGTYYVAAHDVTGTRQNVTLDFMHMDRYDVVAQDVHTVGNGGFSTITFQGNGFRDLYAVDLYTANGDTIHAIDIGHESDASTTVTFDFTDAELGKYDALFHFTEESKTFTSILSVEEARDIELATKVSYPSTFLRGSSVTYSVEITNKGNMTAYFVPTEISLFTVDFSNVTSVIFKDRTGKRVEGLSMEGMDTDSINSDLLSSYIDEINGISGLSSFSILSDSINKREIGFTDRYFSIPPMSTITYQIEIMSTNDLSLYVRVPNKWFAVKIINKHEAPRAKFRNEICCEKEKWECISSNIFNVLGFIPGAAGCLASLGDLGVYSIFEIMCANGESPLDKMKDALSNKTANFVDKGLSAVLSCAGAGILKRIQSLKNELKELEQVRKLKLQQAVNYNRIYQNEIANYDDKMRLAEKYYKEGNIKEAERISEEAISIKNYALRFKEESDNCYKEANRLTSEMNNCLNQIDLENLNMANLLGNIKNGLKSLQDAISCSNERLDSDKNCYDGDNHGGSSSPINSLDPNDIYGYVAPSGSKFVGESVVTLPYRIEFENDTAFATASAHVVEIKDTLDSKLFDLATFVPTDIKIGNKTEHLDGTPNFVKTIDMRPAINTITQVEGKFDRKKGIATWTFTSLDPMTMEPTDDVMQGFLPVNHDGVSGIGEVSYNISLKDKFADGTEIPNRAGIVFDANDPIMTPVWTNTVDAVSPTSHVLSIEKRNDSILTIKVEGEDERSGVWKYEVYAQYGKEAPWWKIGECSADSAQVDFRCFNGIDYGFCVLATDSAGNVESKELAREASIQTYKLGDVNGDDVVNTYDMLLVLSKYLGEDVSLNANAADVDGDGTINTYDASLIQDIYLSTASAVKRAAAIKVRQRKLQKE